MGLNKKKTPRMTAFQEDVLLMNDAERLTDVEENAIQKALANNSAVGVIAGDYDADLTISFASYYFLKNLGYEYNEYDSEKAYSFLNLVQEEDRSLFSLETFSKMEGGFSFHILTKDGAPIYAHGYKTEFQNEDGKAQWMLSVRVSWESFDLALSKKAENEKKLVLEENTAMNELIQAISKLVVRFFVCDIKKDNYIFYDCDNGPTYEASGKYNELIQQMEDHLKPLNGNVTFSDFLNKENIRNILKVPKDVLRFDYAENDESVYYNMAVVPMKFENDTLTKFVMISQDVTQTKLMEMEAQNALKEACAAANHANEAKTEFLAHMSHDIRTPMNAIIGMTAIAGAHIDEKDRVLDSLEKITSASRHLLSLINDLLDMSQIEKGNVIISEDDFNLSELIDEMISMTKPDIEKHHHNFEVTSVNVEHEDVIGDSLKIQQVFTNIIGNAIKYTPDGGDIRLTISEKGTNHPKIGCYEFVFEDNGIGMSKDFLNVIFDPFARENSIYSKEVQGSGLGMAITKNIVNMMNGDIKVESELGKGSKFTVTFFLQLQDQDEENIDELYDLSVLVVDDDEICCESTVETLNSIGMVGEWVNCGKDAIERTVEKHEKANDYFAIIMDWKMPGMDGIETAREIRKRVGKNVPIIMLSAYDYSSIENEAREAGVDLFIAKPLFKSRLKNVFKRIVQGTHQEEKTKDAIKNMSEEDFSNKRILIVEDNALNREIAVELIGMTGVSIETAVNGQEAIDMVSNAEKGYYDLIFMDIQMPVLNGYQATEEIRKTNHGKSIPIIAMTANAFAEDVIKAKNAGFNEHISKPIHIEKVNEVLKRYFN